MRGGAQPFDFDRIAFSHNLSLLHLEMSVSGSKVQRKRYILVGRTDNFTTYY